MADSTITIDLLDPLAVNGVIPVTVQFAETFVRNNTVYVESGAMAFEAGENLGGHRVVRLGPDGKAYYADQSVGTDCLAIIGLTAGASVQGETASVKPLGEMVDESSWTWTPDAPVFLTGVGQLTQTQPASGPVVVVGQAVSATRIVITLQPRIFRE